MGSSHGINRAEVKVVEFIKAKIMLQTFTSNFAEIFGDVKKGIQP